MLSRCRARPLSGRSAALRRNHSSNLALYYGRDRSPWLAGAWRGGCVVEGPRSSTGLGVSPRAGTAERGGGRWWRRLGDVISFGCGWAAAGWHWGLVPRPNGCPVEALVQARGQRGVSKGGQGLTALCTTAQVGASARGLDHGPYGYPPLFHHGGLAPRRGARHRPGGEGPFCHALEALHGWRR